MTVRAPTRRDHVGRACPGWGSRESAARRDLPFVLLSARHVDVSGASTHRIAHEPTWPACSGGPAQRATAPHDSQRWSRMSSQAPDSTPIRHRVALSGACCPDRSARQGPRRLGSVAQVPERPSFAARNSIASSVGRAASALRRACARPVHGVDRGACLPSCRATLAPSAPGCDDARLVRLAMERRHDRLVRS